MKKGFVVFFFAFIAVIFSSGCLSDSEDSLFGDGSDPYHISPMQKMFSIDHTVVQIRLREIPEQKWSVSIDPSDILTVTENEYVPDDYIFNDLGYHKWVLTGVQPGVSTVTFSYDYNGTTVAKHVLTVYVDEEDMSLRIYNKK